MRLFITDLGTSKRCQVPPISFENQMVSFTSEYNISYLHVFFVHATFFPRLAWV